MASPARSRWKGARKGITVNAITPGYVKETKPCSPPSPRT